MQEGQSAVPDVAELEDLLRVSHATTTQPMFYHGAQSIDFGVDFCRGRKIGEPREKLELNQWSTGDH